MSMRLLAKRNRRTGARATTPCHVGLIGLVAIAFGITALPEAAEVSPRALLPAEKLYRDLCANCHGPDGEGVAEKYDEPLYGTRSVESLTRLIHRTMPEDEPEACVDEDAQAVATYIHGAFYSPRARARLNPPRIDLARLTNRQYRESVADLVGGFQRPVRPSSDRGLRAAYYQSKGMNKKNRKVFERTDERMDFDFGEDSPGEGITADQFSIAWQGSLLAPDTGLYELRLTTPNGARLYVNANLKAGDSNRRDDSSARRHTASLDLWVSSGGQPREATTRLFLLGGRAYPLRLDFFKYKETNASVRLEWKPPYGVWSVLGGDALAPEMPPPVTVLTTAFPPDDASLGYERGSSVSKAWQTATTRAAVEAANQVIARLNQLGGTADDAADRVDRLQQFALRFAERAFRRPLSAESRAVYVDKRFQGDSASDLAVKRVVLAVLTSPLFLYPELGGPVDDYTVATRLALALWDSLPDRALSEAARLGKLRSPDSVRAQARRMVKNPRARAKLREFFHHWLAMDEAKELAKDATAFPGFDEALVADLRVSLDKFVDHVVWDEASDYRRLLLADYLFLNERLAEYYGAESTPGEGFEQVTFSSGQRHGIFTHPYLLAAFSYHRSTSPIHRGVFLTRNIMGRFLKPPPIAVAFANERFDSSLTMREKVTELTKSDTCMACHSTINPLGFSLENYDAVGRYRTTDNHQPVDAASDYTTPAGETLRLSGPRDLARHTATSQEARLGFVRQMFQYTIKQTPAAYGRDTLRDLDDGFTRSGYHVRDLFTEIACVAALHESDVHLDVAHEDH